MAEFNRTVAGIEDAQTEIRLIIKEAFLRGIQRKTVESRLSQIIARTVKNVKPDRLKSDIVRSLWNFANRQRALWNRIPFGAELFVLIALGAEGDGTLRAAEKLSSSESARLSELFYEQHQKGVPMQQYYAEVWKEKVQPILNRICRDRAMDPNDLRQRNSLRNLAEMEARYQEHQDNIDRLRKVGCRLVIASSREDCSDRCAPWQGRVYSLDGTRGTTKDGKRFVPLEDATDIYYTTKAGRVYKNGLLGFNCRHALMEYREGMGIPVVSAEARKREYAITQRQRELERSVRNAKTEAVVYRGISDKKAKAAQIAAKNGFEKYRKFCKENGRAFYPMRVSI